MEDRRSKYKATSVAKLKEVVENDDKLVGGSGGANDYIKFEDKATTKIRIAPAPEGEFFYVKKSETWMDVINDEGEKYKTKILNSKVHGDTKMDIIEEYVNFVKNNLDSSDATSKDKLESIIGNNEKDQKKKKYGILPSILWVAQGWQLKTQKNDKGKIISVPEPLKYFDIKKTVRQHMNTLTFIEDEAEAIEVDPFTDVDEGKPVMITFDKSQKAAKMYTVQLAKNPFPLTDEMLDELEARPTLKEKFVGVYTMKDFEKALEALRSFDIENEIDMFDDADFQEIIEKVKEQYEGGEQEEEQPKAKKATAKPVAKATAKPVKKSAPVEEEEEESEQEEESGDEFSNMDRDELKEYIGENDLVGVITLKKSFTDDQIRDLIREAIAKKAAAKPKAKPAPVPESDDEEVDDEPFEEDEEVDEEEEVEKPVATTKAKPNIDDLKKKLLAKTKK
jgi:hypothetical protein